MIPQNPLMQQLLARSSAGEESGQQRLFVNLMGNTAPTQDQLLRQSLKHQGLPIPIMGPEVRMPKSLQPLPDWLLRTMTTSDEISKAQDRQNPPVGPQRVK